MGVSSWSQWRGGKTNKINIIDNLDLPPNWVTVTTKIKTCLVGNPIKTLIFASVPGCGILSYLKTFRTNDEEVAVFGPQLLVGPIFDGIYARQT